MQPRTKLIGDASRAWKFRQVIMVLGLLLLACAGSDLPLNFRKPTPTQPALLIDFEVTVIRPTETATPSPEPTASPTHTPPATQTPTLAAQPPLSPTLTLTPIGASAPVNPAAAAQPISSTATITPTLGWQNSGLSLLEPPDSFAYPADIGPAEFKWLWGEGCQPPPDGQGFEVRIWPDLPNFGPMGAMDAAANQADVACDVKSGTRSYRLGSLRQAPGISAVGSGRFRWDVALVQLKPYTVLAVSGSRVFDLPPDAAVPVATPIPEPSLPLAADKDMAGLINLVEPQFGVALPSTKKVEFKWQWSKGEGCLKPPEGYGFELRVWPNRPDFQPMGAMGDARQSQANIFCDASNGLRGYLVNDLAQAPGVSVAGAGEFRWDVAFIKLEPYTLITTSEARIFTIPGVSKLK